MRIWQHTYEFRLSVRVEGRLPGVVPMDYARNLARLVGGDFRIATLERLAKNHS